MPKRFIAEWEPQCAVLMALPHAGTDWEYILDEALDQYRRIAEAITSEGISIIMLCPNRKDAADLLAACHSDRLTLVEMEYNDTWTRDYGPLAVVKDDRVRALDFGFNGWGLKFAADEDNLVNLRLKEKFVIEPEQYRNERDFILEGGSVESDGAGTILTTTRCLCSPNRNGGKSKKELNAILHDRLGADHVLWLDYGALAGDDTDSHIDTLARIAPNNTILFTGCRDVDDDHFESLLKMRAQLSMFRNAEGEPYNLVELPLPQPVMADGERLPATYANFLVTDNVIFMPTYAQPDNDRLAMQTVRIAYPDRKVVGVDCRTLLRQHGSLHCATMQLHPGEINSTCIGNS